MRRVEGPAALRSKVCGVAQVPEAVLVDVVVDHPAHDVVDRPTGIPGGPLVLAAPVRQQAVDVVADHTAADPIRPSQSSLGDVDAGITYSEHADVLRIAFLPWKNILVAGVSLD
jgi:hypothetical protein